MTSDINLEDIEARVKIVENDSMTYVMDLVADVRILIDEIKRLSICPLHKKAALDNPCCEDCLKELGM